ncbi:MAG: glycoside hydrolase family 2 protein [Lentisphaerae bacterium]|jgi:beta-galactosidase|nr:glycoside hydrolase family 2 protein [Lentisphaerota bacterium]MBT4818583.1 glycoside hydrolase family 2 protein [Lentisphaerota bacterium]MBT5609366.1 glycoside hydrolase family 2 protein [Lentisphaerota bacterium]MBT7057248.1 glycoside hydrolase family 2 protein [Lentisphaerota bacterium]MBT7843507.1 glycoside hydrolase family 2 protein [Lentisphaerota bacterium]
MTCVALDPQNPRTTILLNFDWLHRTGPVAQDYIRHANDRGWATVQLPHDPAVHRPFDHEESTSANGWLPYGVGVYRKRFSVPEDAEGKRVLVEFEGVYRAAEVWVNGHYLGKQLNGYLGFEYDVTSYLDLGGENAITVAYDNRTKGTSRWYTGEGIYRDVWLKVVSPVHVPLHGTYVTTPVVSPETALVAVEADAVNRSERGQVCRLITQITDPNGVVVAQGQAVAPLQPGERYTFRQEIDVMAPQLWELDAPHLYTAVSTLQVDGKDVDRYDTRFGIRSIRMTPERGLLLNGRKVVAVGGDLHHDLGCLGSAALKSGYERHIDELKAIGCNSFRLSHNPHARALLDVCDEKGILIFDELYDKWTSQFYGGEASFESQWQVDLEAFIRRDRNHPCVYIWSMGNEVLKQQGQHDPKFETREAAADYGVNVIKRMAAFTRTLDPSRKVTTGLFPARESFITEWHHWDDYETFTETHPAEMAFYVDVVSWNYTENMFAQDHARYPQLMFIASESAANWGFGPRRPSWLELDPTYVIGHYHWSGYDYLGESDWPKKTWGRALIDLSGWVTPLGRYYQSFYSKTPMIHAMVYEIDQEQVDRFNAIESPRWDWPPMVDHWNWPRNSQLKLTTFTNGDEVELLLNGRSLGTRKLVDCEDRRMDWDVPYEAGLLEAVGRKGGTEVCRHCLGTAGEPTALRLRPHKPAASADGLDAVCVEAALVDEDGQVVPNSGTEIRFNVTGPGTNAGVASGNVVSDEPWQSNARSTWYGRCICVIRTTREAGDVVITANADGLPSARCTVESVPVEAR